MKVALYARVSKKETDPLGKMYQEPMNQIEPMRKYCEDMGWEVKFEFVDRKSGADSNRPEFQKMLAETLKSNPDGHVSSITLGQ